MFACVDFPCLWVKRVDSAGKYHELAIRNT
jgi:hypothetical protein